LRLGKGAPAGSGFLKAAKDRNMPLAIETVEDEAGCAAYERRLVLVRPDGHVAWRSDLDPVDAGSVLDVVRGEKEQPARQRLEASVA
jgi:hypothetical protein